MKREVLQLAGLLLCLVLGVFYVMSRVPKPAPIAPGKLNVVDESAPSAAITAPLSGETVSGIITIKATTSDNVGVVKVKFYDDGSLFATTATSPFQMTYDTTVMANGLHSFAVEAFDATGNMGAGVPVFVTVSNAVVKAK